MDIPQKIDSIIEARQAKLPQIRNMQEHLDEVNDALCKLDEACKEAGGGTAGKFHAIIAQYPEIAERLRFINTESTHKNLDSVREMLGQLETRFAREQVHISFVGRAGQGKSLIMQNISGLSSDIIPSSDGSDCTGAKSIITNSDVQDVSAEIVFYKPSEYVETVNNYLRAALGANAMQIYRPAEILRLDERALLENVDKGDIKKVSAFQKLKDYIKHSDEVLPLLGTTKTIPSSEIESYVAQYSHADKDKKYFKYLGVKVANIHCAFPCAECGKIVLVDTIGLGAVALGVHDQMINTVSNDSDAILLMTRPETKRPKLEEDDVNIVKSISDKLSSEYTHRMLFWVLNRVTKGPGINTEGIPEIKRQLLEMQSESVASIIDVDCNDRNALEQQLLIPVLEKVSAGLPETDTLLMKKAEAQLHTLYQEYHSIAEQVGRAFLASIDQDVRREFDGRIGATISRMTNSIRDLYINEPYGALRNKPCEDFQDAVEEKLRHILQYIPSKAEIMELLNNGTINQHNAYEYLTDKMRLRIINDFLEVNQTLHKLVLKMKQKVVFCLADESCGCLDPLVTASVQDADSWLEELIELLTRYSKYSLLVDAMKKLLDFDLRMEGFLIYRVRAHLNEIDLSLIEHGPPLMGTLAEKEQLADDIRFWLDHYLEIVRNEIKKDLKEFYDYPNNALWATVKDFYDRIAYAHEGSVDVKTAWRYLYEDYIPSVWQKEYGLYLAQKGISKEWNELVDEIHKYDRSALFCFTHEEG